MKDVFKRVFPVVLAYLAVGFVCALFIAFRQDVSTYLLPPFESAFKMHDAVIRFVQFYPALIAAGLLTGYSAAFRKLIPEGAGRNRQSFAVFRNAFIFCIVLAAVYAVLAEGFTPVLKSRQAEAIAKTDAYNNYMFLCRRESDFGNFRAAFANADAALAIWRDSPEAQKASDTARIMAEEQREDDFAFAEEEGAIDYGQPSPQGGYSSQELLEKAREAAAQTDFYNAHYYATLSWRTAAEDDPDKEAARRLAVESWNRITEALDEMRAEDDRLYYERKLKGYSYIQAGDFLSAYYHFRDMKEEAEAAGSSVDPDVETFLEIARQGVLGSFFFVDETESLALFEQEGGIFFTLPNDEGGKDAVFIGGVFRRSTGAEDGAYFRDFEMARFDGRNALLFQISAPYAKMFPLEDSDGNTRPQIVLTAVYRAKGSERIEPRVVAGRFPPQDALSASVLDLDMPYEDMTLIINSAAGVDLMTIPHLFSFERRAGRYGLQTSVYLAELVQRVSAPFVVFIMAVLALVWAHKFQIKQGRPFSAWWIIPTPFIAVGCGYIIAAVRHALNLCFMLFAAKMPALTIPLGAVLVVVLLFAVSAWFFAQRGKA